MQLTARPPSAPLAADLESALRAEGCNPGRPPTYAPMSAAVDRQTARKLACRGCGTRGLVPQPIRWTCKLVRWRKADVLAWVDGLTQPPPAA